MSDHGPHRQRVENFLQRIDTYNKELNAMMEPTPDIARATADATDLAEQQGRSMGALHGVVVALKDNIDTAGIRTTSGSKLFEEYVPAEDATVWRNMREAGAILIGKAGLHECVFGPTSQNVWFGRIRNPWNTEHVPGGSSGGSGAAVAADFCDVALGTDTGGSVRIPSAMCGLTGLRGTVGAVPNTATRPISPHLDTTGPMAWSVHDVAKAWSVMQAYDAEDETSRRPPAPLDLSDLDDGARGLKIGVPTDWFTDGLHSGVESAYQDAQERFRELGAEIVPLDLPGASEAARVCPRIIVADAADYYHEDIQHRPDRISDEVMKRMKLGFDVTGIEYANCMRKMYSWQREIENACRGLDAIMTPTLSMPAPTIAESDDLLNVVSRITPFTMAWALGGGPSLALPAGFTDEGLPVSVQLAGPRFTEPRLLRLGAALQTVTDFHLKRPAL